MTLNHIRQALALAVAAGMLFCAASCEVDSDKAADSSPETAYPLLSERQFSVNGETESEEIFTYDAGGNPVKREYRVFDDSDIRETDWYEYKQGMLVRKTERHTCAEREQADEIVYDYQYDASGLLTETAKSVNGTYKGKVSFMRGGSGKIKRVIYYDADNGFQGMVEHKYDASGNCIEEKEYDPQRMISRNVFLYNESGQLTECLSFDKEGKSTTYRFSYGNGGERVRQVCLDEKGKEVKRIEYKAYDENGSCTKEAHYRRGDDAISFYCERTYGAEKVNVPAWELQNCRFHGDFLP